MARCRAITANHAAKLPRLASKADGFRQSCRNTSCRTSSACEASEAEDVLQEVFLQLWRNPSAFDSNRGSLAAWLAVIARHRAIDHLRRRRPEADFEEVVLSVDPQLDSQAARGEAIGRIRAVMETMSDEQRIALEMAFFEGLTHTEIAEKTGEPLGTIKTRIRSALIAIRKALSS